MQGAQLGPYRLERELGTGGMGAVWLATKGDERVALKLVHPHLLATPSFFQRFQREAELGRRVVHENVVRTLDCDAAGDAHFLVMEYVEGQTLRQLLGEVRRVPEELCRHVGREIARGLAAIHAVGIVHRDLKPENVIISRCIAPGHGDGGERPAGAGRGGAGGPPHRCDHAVKIMDLGVARAADDARLTQTGAFVGSLQYAAPEQFTGDSSRIDSRTDLHALGLVLYELAAGVHPFEAADWRRAMDRLLRERAAPLSTAASGASPFLEALVAQLLEKDPAQRPESAAELARILDEGEHSPWWTSRSRATGRVARRRVPHETSHYGRDAELAALSDRLDAARRSEGCAVLIEGEAGIGKSRLIDEFAALAHDAGDVAFLRGAWPSGGAATAAGPFVDAFRERLADEGEALRALRASPALARPFAALLRGEAPPAGAEALTGELLRSSFVHAVCALAEDRTTVMFVDDLHDAPGEGRAILAALVHAAPGRRLLVVAASRPGLPPAWVANLARLPQMTRITVPRLPDVDAARMLQSLVRARSLMDELPAQVVAKAGGNPLFLLEVVRGLREAGVIRTADDGLLVRTSASGAVQIPSTLREMTAARLAGLSREDRELLDVAACVGTEFDPALVGHVLGSPRIPLLRALGRIENEHRLVRSAGTRFAFDHVQVRETLHEALSEALRREYHLAVGDALERRAGTGEAWIVDACTHFLRGADPARALPHLERALRRLSEDGAHAARVDLGDSALAVSGLLTGGARYQVLRGNAHSLDRLGRGAEQMRALEEAAVLAPTIGDPSAPCLVAKALGWNLIRYARYDEARVRLHDALDDARRRNDRVDEEHGTRLLGILEAHLGHTDESLRCFRAARAIARELGDRDSEAASTINLGIGLFAVDRFDEARAEAERGLALAREAGNRRWEANAVSSLLSASLALGRFDDALSECETALRLAREAGYREAEATALSNLAIVLVLLGDTARARVTAEAAVALSRELGSRLHTAERVRHLALVDEASGRMDVAESRLRDALAEQREIQDVRGAAATAYALGSLLRREGRADDARMNLRDAARDAKEGDVHAVAALAAIEAAMLPGGDLAAACAGFEEQAPRLDAPNLMRAHLLLHQAGAGRGHLEAAKRLLDSLVDHAPARFRESMLANVRVHREIVEAASAHGLGAPPPAG